jgi:hypothetical protein
MTGATLVPVRTGRHDLATAMSDSAPSRIEMTKTVDILATVIACTSNFNLDVIRRMTYFSLRERYKTISELVFETVLPPRRHQFATSKDN